MIDIARSDDGVSLIELIVGLAIASFLALSIGGLLTFSIQAKDRLDKASKIEASLLDLKIAAGVLDQLTPIDASFRLDSAGTDLVMMFDAPNRDQRSIRVQLVSSIAADAGDGSALRLQDDLGRMVGPVSLATFDGADLEFLAWQAGRLAWLSRDEVGDVRLLGLRVALRGEGREWKVLLWAARSRGPA